MALTKAEFVHDGNELHVTKSMFDSWRDNGYIIIRSLFCDREIVKLKSVLESKTVQENAGGRDDGNGRKTKSCVWNQPGDDVSGMVARSNKVAGTVEQLLGGEIYHYHSKVIMKDALVGASYRWHQDYGYWYHYGCLFPDMASVFIAVDKATKENGCLQILSGSHKMGRIEHILTGGQAGVDPERLDLILKSDRFEKVYLELEPGDACYFHCNILHSSAQNHSTQRRWAFIIAYNRASNDPVFKTVDPQYSYLEKVPDSAIVSCTNFDDLEAKDFVVTSNLKSDFNVKVS